MNVVISKLIESNVAISPRSGEVVYSYLDEAISKSEKVVLDFSGIEMMTTAFLNVAIGQLYHKFKPEQLNDSLTLINLEKEDVSLFLKVISRAKDYFKDQEAFNQKMNQRYEDE
jgi:hypothetical protein